MTDVLDLSGLTETDLHMYADGQLAPSASRRWNRRLPAIRRWPSASPRSARRTPRYAMHSIIAVRTDFRAAAAGGNAARRWVDKPHHPTLAGACLCGCGDVAVGRGSWLVRPWRIDRACRHADDVRRARRHSRMRSMRPMPDGRSRYGPTKKKCSATGSPNAWAFPVHAPDLNSVGFALVGGRLVAGNENPTALFMYENGDKQRLSLQARKPGPGTGDTAFRYASRTASASSIGSTTIARTHWQATSTGPNCCRLPAWSTANSPVPEAAPRK
jgi:anti-sigma factor RsiW